MLLRHALVHTGTGETIPDCDIRIENGKIAAVGKGLETGVETQDLSGKHVFPGFIDAGGFAGATDMAYHAKDFNENSDPSVPHLDIWHSIDPDEITRQELYKSGVTSIAVSPGNQNVLGGTVAVVKSYGKNLNRMTVRRDAALKGSVTREVSQMFGPKAGPRTRMAMVYLLKNAIERTDYPDDYRGRRTRQIMDSVRGGEIPLVVAAETSAEIESVLDVLAGGSVKPAFVLAYQAARASEAIRRAGAQVILGEFSHYSSVLRHEADFGALVGLAKNGVPFSIALLSGDATICGRECYFWTAAKLAQGGAGEDLLLDMMCGNPARLYGVSHRIGALAPGLDADLAVFDGNPMTQVNARLVETVIDGRAVYRAGEEAESCCC
jgi:imidazolonepropionase-like amidohydrolase